MATNIEKTLPGMGTEAVMEETLIEDPAIEIEIEDPESVTIGIGDIEINIDPDAESDEDFGANLAEYIEESELQTIADDLLGDYEDDLSSRKDWMQTYVDGLELLGMKIEDRTEPWEGACGVYHPLLSEALVKFQSETIIETFPASGPVRTKILGEDTDEKIIAAQRVQEDMNYELTEVMVEYRPEHERMLWGLGLAGNAFKKVYFDPTLERQVSIFVPAEDVVVPYGASNLESSPRVTHVMRKTKNDLRKLQVAGFYRDIDLGEPNNTLDDVEKKIAQQMGFQATTDDRYKILEIQTYLDLKDYEDKDKDGKPTGIALPYIVTIEKGTSEVLAVRRNWNPEDDSMQKRNHFVHYPYVPGFGFYAFGLIHLIGAFAKSGTSIIRQLVDAGTLSNLPGGLKAKGMRVKGDDTPISPGEFRDVDLAAGSIRENILPLPYKEPSQVLFMLMNSIVEEGRRFASAADLKISDMSANSPVGTTLAILERTLKVMSAVQARVHYAMKQELKLLKEIIADCTDDKYKYVPVLGNKRAKKADYDMVEVVPVSDPNSATMSQKVVQYQAVMQMAQSNPAIFDMIELNKQMLEVLGIKNIPKLIPQSKDEVPTDPVQENMDIINGKPVKAFAYQDHAAHIKVHQNAMNDPKLAMMIGNNPQAPIMQAAILAHINEHIAFEYRRQIEEMAGVPLPSSEKGMPKELEKEISQLLAAASDKLLQKDQAEMAQQKAVQAAQDPIVQMQQAELALKEREIKIKEQKVVMDAAADADRLELDKEKLQAELQIEGMKAGVKIEKDRTEQANKMELEGVKIGAEIGKERLIAERKGQ